MSKNLLALYNQALPEHINKGLQWYELANLIASHFADRFNIPINTIAQVISALSPRCNWNTNIKDTERMLQAFTTGQHHTQFKVITYNQNKIKAWNILEGKTTIEDTAKKTYAFANNILGNYEPITVDRHAYRAYYNKPSSYIVGSIPKRIYDRVQNQYTLTAKRLGFTPAQFQAIIWTVYKHKEGITQ